VAGVVSGFLPVVQGWVFILAGLTVMAPESQRARRLLEWAKEKIAIRKRTDDTGNSRGGAAVAPSESSTSVPRGGSMPG